MLNTKKILSSTLVIASSFALASCSFLDTLLGTQLAIKDGKFIEDTTYNLNLSVNLGPEFGTSYLSLKFEFDTEGTMKETNLKDSTASEYPYTVDKDLIILGEDGKSGYLNYFGDLIGYDALIAVGTAVKDGVTVSDKSATSVIGYICRLSVDVGDVPAVFTGDKDSKGCYYEVYQNGTVSTKEKYLSADQISGFDSSVKGSKVVDVTIGNKTTKQPLYVGGILG